MKTILNAPFKIKEVINTECGIRVFINSKNHKLVSVRDVGLYLGKTDLIGFLKGTGNVIDRSCFPFFDLEEIYKNDESLKHDAPITVPSPSDYLIHIQYVEGIIFNDESIEAKKLKLSLKMLEYFHEEKNFTSILK